MKIQLKKNLDFYLGGSLLVLMYYPVRWVGLILRRRHDLKSSRHLLVIKLLGGGSLFMALPALLALRKERPAMKISVLCGRSIAEFARAYDIFDEIHVIDDRSFLKLILSTLKTLFWMNRKVDTTLDFEIHSRLTTVLTTLAMVRNRVGLVDPVSLWRNRLYTHSIYVNPLSPIFHYYDGVCQLFELEEVSLGRLSEHLKKIISLDKENFGEQQNRENNLCLGVGCSDLAFERRLDSSKWRKILDRILAQKSFEKIIFLGSKADRQLVEEIYPAGLPPGVLNLCGELALRDSLRILSQSRAYIGVDSALLHFARQLCQEVVSFWGPTSAEQLLRPLNIRELTFSRQLSCSPCTHQVETPPCRGQNICMNFESEVDQVAEFFLTSNRKNLNDGSKTFSFWAFFPDSESPRRLEIKIQ